MAKDGGRTREEARADDALRRLGRSKFRSGFGLGAQERDYLDRKGLGTVLSHGRDFIDRRLAPARPPGDGRQTPWKGHPVFVAQHATATCCRSCLSKWHGIPKGRELTERETGYVLLLIGKWLSRRPVD